MKSLLIISSIICILFSIIGYSITQEIQISKEYLKIEGWEIPGLDYCTDREVIKETPLLVEQFKLQKQIFVPQWYFIADEDREKIESKTKIDYDAIIKWRVNRIIKYTACGEVFAYGVEYVPVVFPIHEGEGGALGSTRDVIYYDNNGDGIFETLTRNSLDIKLPQWICSEH